MKTGLLTVDGLAGLIKGTAGVLSGRTANEALSDLGIGQAWTTPAFNAADFTAPSPMTWTVAAGDVVTYLYTEIGKIMILVISIYTSTLGGTASNYVKIKIPNGKTPVKTGRQYAQLYDSGWVHGFITTFAGNTDISLYKSDQSNLTICTDLFYAFATIIFETT